MYRGQGSCGFHGKRVVPGCSVFGFLLVDHECRIEELVGLGIISLAEDQDGGSVVDASHETILFVVELLLEWQIGDDGRVVRHGGIVLGRIG